MSYEIKALSHYNTYIVDIIKEIYSHYFAIQNVDFLDSIYFLIWYFLNHENINGIYIYVIWNMQNKCNVWLTWYSKKYNL